MNVLHGMAALAVALAIGLLIGLERGWRERDAAEGTRVAGVRTFGLIGLLGGLIGLLALETSLSLLGLAFAGVAAALVAGYVVSARRGNDVGITSLVAGLATFALGAATTLGHMAAAAAAAVVMALLLGYKPTLHRWVQAIEHDELRATLKLALISVVLLPILPDRGFGPWHALNPYEIWWMVVLISGISFVGYFAMRIAGPGKGALLTALLAGLASTTALTLHFSRLARRSPPAGAMLAPAILVACGTMFPRMAVVAGIVEPRMFPALVVPTAVMAAVTWLGALILWRRAARSDDAQEQPARLSNPLELGSAIGFGALLALIMLGARALEAWFGDTGLVLLAAISGITDVDAITLTMSRLAGTEVGVPFAAAAVVVAGAVNSTVKAAMAAVVGGRVLGLRVAFALIAAAVAGLAAAGLGGGAGAIG